MADLPTSAWKIILGDKPVLLVASHNFPQIRGDEIKPADIGTGDLVERLCDDFTVNGIVSEVIQADPNWFTTSEFRLKIREIIKERNIKAVIDIHGRKEGYQFLTEYLPNKLFKKNYPEFLSIHHVTNFKDNEQMTLCEELDNWHVPGVEVEIRRDGRTNSPAHEQVLAELGEIIRSI